MRRHQDSRSSWRKPFRMCHESVLSFGQTLITRDDVLGKAVIEVGSFDVNGSLRSHVTNLLPLYYIGVDMREGPGVDLVCDATRLVEQFSFRFDLLISTEMLEHVIDWKTAISNMKRVLCPGGKVILTTRSPGFPL